MAKLYWAHDPESTLWCGPHETIEACKQDALECGEAGAEIWVAPVDAGKDDDAAFWAAVAKYVASYVEGLSESLIEDGWLDPEELGFAPTTDRNGILARALRDVLGPRPAWRTVDTAKAERVEL